MIMSVNPIKPDMPLSGNVPPEIAPSTIPLEKTSVDVEAPSRINEQDIKEELNNITQALNSISSSLNKKIHFQVHKATNRTMVEVIDRNTNEVIREIPPKEFLDLVARMHQYMGAIFNKQA